MLLILRYAAARRCVTENENEILGTTCDNDGKMELKKMKLIYDLWRKYLVLRGQRAEQS